MMQQMMDGGMMWGMGLGALVAVILVALVDTRNAAMSALGH
jgi:hypothetical protein